MGVELLIVGGSSEPWVELVAALGKEKMAVGIVEPMLPVRHKFSTQCHDSTPQPHPLLVDRVSRRTEKPCKRRFTLTATVNQSQISEGQSCQLCSLTFQLPLLSRATTSM